MVYAAQALGLHVGINFCGAYVGMAKQHLHGTQVCAALKQVSGKGMPERMGRDGAANASLKRVFFNHFPHILTRQGTARAVDEELIACWRKRGLQALMQSARACCCIRSLRAPAAFFGTLAQNAHKAALQVKIRHAHGAQLRNAQACGVQKFKHAAVAPAAFIAQVWLGKQDSISSLVQRTSEQMLGAV